MIATARPIDAPTRTADKSRKWRFALARARVPAELRRGIAGAFGMTNGRFPRHGPGLGRPLGGEAYLFGAQITPLISASTHVVADKMRNRKLLLHKAELNRLIGAVERKGYTVIPLSLYWKGNRVKVELGLAKGKKEHDKRDTEKERDWQRDKGRIMRERNR